MDKVWGVVRHVVGILGGVLIGFGWVSTVDWSSFLTNLDTAYGGVAGALAIGASIYAKFNGTGGLGGLFGKK
jgi:hypothetical protein